MNGIIGRTSSHWVRYSDYEWKPNTDGVLYLTPVKNARPSIYDPMKEYEQMQLEIGELAEYRITETKEISKRKMW